MKRPTRQRRHLRALCLLLVLPALVLSVGCDESDPIAAADAAADAARDSVADPATDTEPDRGDVDSDGDQTDAQAGAPIDCEVVGVDATRTEPGLFYECLDSVVNDGQGCGPTGYPLGFGRKYAVRFMAEVLPEVGPEAQAFLDRNLICLQAALAAGLRTTATCDEVAGVGFASHVPCYLENDFCEVPIVDMLAILEAVDLEDREDSRQQQAMGAVARECLGTAIRRP